MLIRNSGIKTGKENINRHGIAWEKAVGTHCEILSSRVECVCGFVFVCLYGAGTQMLWEELLEKQVHPAGIKNKVMGSYW